MFFSFSLFPPGISARCSRSAFQPGVSARRCLVRGAFPRSVCLWGLVRFCRRFCLASLLRVSVRHFRPAFGSALPPVIPGLRSRPAFPPGVWVCATACCSRSAFPPGISLRRCLVRGAFPRSVCLCGACPLLHGLFSACGYFRIRQKTRLPESGRWLAALRRLPPGPFFRTGRRLRQRRNPRRTGCKVTYNSLIIAAFTIYSQFLQQRLRSP